MLKGSLRYTKKRREKLVRVGRRCCRYCKQDHSVILQTRMRRGGVFVSQYFQDFLTRYVCRKHRDSQVTLIFIPEFKLLVCDAIFISFGEK